MPFLQLKSEKIEIMYFVSSLATMLREMVPWMLLEILEYFRMIFATTGEKNALSDY